MTAATEIITSGSTSIFQSHKPHRVLSMSAGFVYIHKMNDKYFADVSFHNFTMSDKHELEWEDTKTRHLMVGRFFPVKTEDGYTIQVDVTDLYERKVTVYRKVNHFFDVINTFNY